jgi:hypothetical protein
MPGPTGTNIILYIQVTCYCIAAILSLCITIPMSMHQDNFKGNCLLFTTGEWQEINGLFQPNWASQAYCNFTIFVGVIMFVISATQIYRFSVFLYKGKDSSFFSAFVDVLSSVFVCSMTLTAGLFITLGVNVWCGEMTRRFENCADATSNEIFPKGTTTSDTIDQSGFYVQMFTAQFGVWLSWATWCGLVVFALLKLCRYHQQENIRVSMAKERKRLINEDLVQEVPVSQNQKPGRDNPAQEDIRTVLTGNRIEVDNPPDLLH